MLFSLSTQILNQIKLPFFTFLSTENQPLSAPTTMSQTQSLRLKLDALYGVMQSLSPSSSPEDFEIWGSFFSEDCTVYLRSMNLDHMPGYTGRASAIQEMKEVVKTTHIESRTVLSCGASEDGRSFFCETEQRLNILGEIIEGFRDTTIVKFNDEGLITEMKLYNCRSPIVRIVQDKTGMGPYSEGEERMKWESFVEAKVEARRRLGEEARRNMCCGSRL